MLALNLQEILDLLARACTWNFGGQKQTTQDLSAGESGRILYRSKADEMLIADPHSDEMPETPH